MSGGPNICQGRHPLSATLVPTVRRPTSHPWQQLALLALLSTLILGAGPWPPVHVDDWAAHGVGPLDLSAAWRIYPPAHRAMVFKQPPAIALDNGRRVLQLVTDKETMAIGRPFAVDARETPWLVWEWKALLLPEGGDVRSPRRNDQAGRVMLLFEGMRAILYVWDTTAPIGAEARSDSLDLFQRVLIVVRSGPQGIGEWQREKRDVYRDYRRLFEDEPTPIKWVGLESHSDDVRSQSSVLFGSVHFEAR